MAKPTFNSYGAAAEYLRAKGYIEVPGGTAELSHWVRDSWEASIKRRSRNIWVVETF